MRFVPIRNLCSGLIGCFAYMFPDLDHVIPQFCKMVQQAFSAVFVLRLEQLFLRVADLKHLLLNGSERC